MKFLCDGHISYKVVNYLTEAGYETAHVTQILDRWNTKDKDICKYADKNKGWSIKPAFAFYIPNSFNAA
ncbi:MAG: DUF5615 family PIN-like protein [Bacteroidota bacterium]|nr:DUF5615 family PIN-like protein [Bacteroidota bacterium]